MKYWFTYETMRAELEAVISKPAQSDSAFVALSTNRDEWIRQTFHLCLLGNALARDKGWQLWGMDAIEYAIIRRYSWSLEEVRALPVRDKWLVLHEELAGLELDELAKAAWKEHEAVLPGEAGSPDDPWRSRSPGFQLPADPQHRRGE